MMVGELDPVEYGGIVEQGWRKFGMSVFKPNCIGCRECQSLRIPVATFTPNRSQKRALAANPDLRLEIGRGHLTPEKLDLYDRFHSYREQTRHWPAHERDNGQHYIESFLEGPCPPEEWRYYLGRELVAVGYVDRIPNALSDVYFFYAPEHRNRSLGIVNVLKTIENAKSHGLDYVYLGYYVRGCQSVEYKAGFRPNQVRTEDGAWVTLTP
jgi:arginine-tRNA-protein transferase